MRSIFIKIFSKKITILVFLGLVLRVLGLKFLPFDPNKYSDSIAYLDIGKALMQGSLETNNVMPLFPLLTALLGGSRNTIYFNIFLSTLSIFLVYKISLAIFKKERAALLGAFLTATYPYFIFYSLTIMTETLYIFLTLFAFSLLYQNKFLGGSAIFTLSILTRPVADPLIPLLIFTFAAVTFRMGKVVALKKLLIYFCIYAFLMAPWWVYNYRKFNQFQRLNPIVGGSFYTGNNVNFIKYELTRDPVYMDKLINDCSPFDKIPDVVLRNKALLDASFENIRNSPIQYLRILKYKFMLFWKLYPTGAYRGYVWVSLLTYGVVLLFSVYFIIFLWRPYWRLVLPIIIFICYLTLVHLILIPSMRYRMPLDPFLIIFSSFAFVTCFARVSKYFNSFKKNR